MFSVEDDSMVNAAEFADAYRFIKCKLFYGSSWLHHIIGFYTLCPRGEGGGGDSLYIVVHLCSDLKDILFGIFCSF